MLNLTKQDMLKVVKPARYVGGEYNQIIKDKEKIKCRVALCMPDIYDVVMSSLEMKIIYNILNKRLDTWCERAFAVGLDFEEIMRKKHILLYGLESKDSINNFDIVSFNLDCELNYTNVLNMLELANIEIYSKDRDKSFPFVMATRNMYI